MTTTAVLGLLLCFLLNISVLPQILKTWRTKRVDDLSVGAYLLALLGFICALVYCAVAGSGGWLIANYTIGLLLDLTMLVLIIRYRT